MGPSRLCSIILAASTWLSAGAIGCSSEPEGADRDASTMDTGATDSGDDLDTGVTTDAGPEDSGASADTGVVDGGVVDGGFPSDSGGLDSGLPVDGGPVDSGVQDAGVPVDAGQSNLDDPEVIGPESVTSSDQTVSVTGDSIAVHCEYPSASGSYPAVLLLRGFRLSPTLYYGTAEHIASFGYVVCLPDYPTSALNPNHALNATQVSDTIDWLLGSSLAGSVDSNRIALVGHSLGGKVGVLTASGDNRVTAYVGLDPVDGSMLCNATDCPDASDLMPLGIPTAFLGETIDAAGGFQPCAPAADNYTTFFDPSTAPSLEVTLTGANHMSFVDDPEACGLTCSFCNMPTQAQADLIRYIRSYVVSFLQVHVAGETGYEEFLTGTQAQARYVGPGHVTLRQK